MGFLRSGTKLLFRRRHRQKNSSFSQSHEDVTNLDNDPSTASCSSSGRKKSGSFSRRLIKRFSFRSSKSKGKNSSTNGGASSLDNWIMNWERGKTWCRRQSKKKKKKVWKRCVNKNKLVICGVRFFQAFCETLHVQLTRPTQTMRTDGSGRHLSLKSQIWGKQKVCELERLLIVLIVYLIKYFKWLLFWVIRKKSRRMKRCFVCSAQGGDVNQSSSKPPTLCCCVFLLFILISTGCTLELDQIVYSAGERFITFDHFVFCKDMTLNYYSLPNWEFLIYYIWCSLSCVLSCFAVVNGNLDQIAY